MTILETLIEQARPLGVIAEIALCPFYRRQGRDVIDTIRLTGLPGVSASRLQPVDAAEALRRVLSANVETDTVLTPRPYYAGLDNQGYPLVKFASVVGHLHYTQVRQALDLAMPEVEQKLKMKAVDQLHSALPLYESFGLKRSEIQSNPDLDLLLGFGSSVSLDFVPTYQSSLAS
ncbi:hypothetical protein [Pseudomonas sp. NPDC096950]|uniref:hypothetical protein n=1 Tax=Pseudomonas sp. NPDC096950 TaxID=3364485 RepID=UPI00383A6084